MNVGTSANAGPSYQKLYGRVTHVWGNRRGQPSESASKGPRSGRIPCLIRISSPSAIPANRDPKYGPFTIDSTRNSQIGTGVTLVPAVSLSSSYARKRKQRRYGIRLADCRDSASVAAPLDTIGTTAADLAVVGGFGSLPSTSAISGSVSGSTSLRSKKHQSTRKPSSEEWLVREHKTRNYRDREPAMAVSIEEKRNSGKVIRAKATRIPDVVEDLLESMNCTRKNEDERSLEVFSESIENNVKSLIEEPTSTFAQTSHIGTQVVQNRAESKRLADNKDGNVVETGYEMYKEKCRENGFTFPAATVLESEPESMGSGTVEIKQAHSVTTIEAFSSHTQYSNQIYTMSKATDSHLVGNEDLSTASMAFIGGGELHVDVYCADKALTCKLCPKTFPHQRQLAKHIAGHYREKPFQCNMCGKCFGQRGHLSTHMRIHSGEKPYKCKICKRDFSQKVNLNTHMRKHSGERPYKCVVCEKAFYDQGNCLKHTRTHSREKRKSKTT